MVGLTEWREWEGDDVPGFMFIAPLWIEDTPAERVALAYALKQIGVTESSQRSNTLAENATFRLGWYGFVGGDLFPEVCDEHGTTEDGATVDVPFQVTFAVITSEKQQSLHASLMQ
jgi:hypothetical protein